MGGGQQNFVSLFCGSCAIESLVMANNKILNDAHPYLIAMWEALQRGWIPPEIVDVSLYNHVRQNKDEAPALAGFIGFGCSFGGKWFGGMARNNKGDNYCARPSSSLMKALPALMDAHFTCRDYRDVPIPDGSLVYADPPYSGTTGYSTGAFDTDAFWAHMRTISKKSAAFISEQSAPDDFECVWEQPLRRQLDVNKNNAPMKVERLFKMK